MAFAHFNLAERGAPAVALAQRLLAHPLSWVALVVGVLVAANAALTGPGLSQSLGDTDDAVRLLTVRELLAGASLFDTSLSRIGAPDPLVSHWSRLIDVPLAAMIALLRPVVGGPAAEWLTRALWPLLLFVAICSVFAVEARRLAGPWATGIALSLVAIMPIAMVQFRPGRIDHHNAQILCAVAGLLLLRRALEDPRAGWWAGLCLGLGLAVGYEGIALVVPMTAAAGLIYLLAPAVGRGPVNAAVAASLTLLAVLVATTAPSRLAVVSCDALSLNLVALAGCSAAALWVVSVIRPPVAVRFAIAGLGAGLGGLVFATLEPACLAGPFGQVDPAIGPIWLDHVVETQTLFKFAAENVDAGAPIFVVLLAGCASQIVLLMRKRTLPVAFATVAMLLAVVLGLWQIKLVPYAVWLSAMSVAVLTAELRADPRTMSLALRGLMALLLLITFSDTLAGFVLPAKDATAPAPTSHLQDQCYRTANVEKLGALQPGLVAASTDLGPYIATLTPHRVVAAPYHRIPKGILAMHEILHGEPEAARARARALGVDYIAACVGASPSSEPQVAKGLRARLLAGERFDWLEPVTLDVQNMRLWRIVR